MRKLSSDWERKRCPRENLIMGATRGGRTWLTRRGDESGYDVPGDGSGRRVTGRVFEGLEVRVFRGRFD